MLSDLPGGEKAPGLSAQRVEFSQLKHQTHPEAGHPGRRLFKNIPLVLSGELGTAEMSVRELLALEEGSVIRLDKMVGESATVLVNEQYLGQAEVVVVNERFGLRITAIGQEEGRQEKEEQEKKGDSSPPTIGAEEPEPESPPEE